MNAIKFIKAHGLGNDFVIIEAFAGEVLTLSASQIAAIANRKTGVGCDQLIIIENSDKADCKMKIFNADGSKAEACGNATRCVAYIMMKKLSKESVLLEINGGIFAAHMEGEIIVVNMGKPEFLWSKIPALKPISELPADYFAPLYNPILVNVGNPHVVFFVEEDAHKYDLNKIGPKIETDPLFPKKINVSLAQEVSANIVNLSVWERGVGLTDACGTAACAAGVVYMQKHQSVGPVSIRFKRGQLSIRLLESGEIEMGGEACVSFVGEVFV